MDWMPEAYFDGMRLPRCSLLNTAMLSAIYFGYPQAHEDDAERAVRAGLELVAAVICHLLFTSSETALSKIF